MQKTELYPLKFKEIYKEKIWGGRRLEKNLNKALPAGLAIGESWEVSDHPNGLSVVRTGPLEGKTIRELIDGYGKAFLGSELPESARFPLLIKFLDISEDVSLQVHPNAETATKFGEESAKHEAWYVISAEEKAYLICGLKPGVTTDEIKPILEADMPYTVRKETLKRYFNHISVRKGDIINLPAGTPHAAGGGLVLAEVQQNSDVTYRMFDWGRTEPNGLERPLHLEKAFAAIHEDPSAGRVQITKLSSYPYDLYKVIENDQFSIELIETTDTASETHARLSGRRFHILTMISGNGELEYRSPKGRHFYTPFAKGETILLPASLGDYSIHGFSLRFLKFKPAIAEI